MVKKFGFLFVEEPKLHILINNAGVMRCPRQLTAEGIEMQIGVLIQSELRENLCSYYSNRLTILDIFFLPTFFLIS